VKRGVPFRSAHSLVGQAVRRAAELGLRLDQLSLEELQDIHPGFQADVVQVFDFQASISRRQSLGGTAPGAVRSQLTQAKELLKD